MEFTARVAGETARVKIRSSHLEWSLVGRSEVIEMVPISAIESATMKRHYRRRWHLSIATARAVVQFEVDGAIGAAARRHLQHLVDAVEEPTDIESTSADDDVGRASLAAELASLDWLYEAGVLTSADLDSERARLLRTLLPQG